MNKHAYLIMAHQHTSVLRQLLRQLDDVRNDIYLHMDLKCSEDGSAYFDEVQQAQLFLVPRLNVRWGAYSQIDCEVNLLKIATRKKYLYYHLLSGDSLTLKNQDQIHQFFNEHTGQEFIQFQAKEPTELTLKRIRYFYPATPFNKTKLVRGVKAVGIKLQNLVGIDRLANIDFIPQKGGTWFSITDRLARYLIEKEPWFARRFRHTYAPDEFFVQTIVENSEFKSAVFDQAYSDSCQSCLRYIKWTDDCFGPVLLTMTDLNEIRQSGCLFARKFGSQDSVLLEQINQLTS